MNSAPFKSDVREMIERRLSRRYRAEQRFRLFGAAAVFAAMGMLVLLIGSIGVQAVHALSAYQIDLPVSLTASRIDPRDDRSEESLRSGAYGGILQDAMREQFPAVTRRAELRELFALYTPLNAPRLMEQVVADPALVGREAVFRMPISDDADLYLKGLMAEEFSLTPTAAARPVAEGDDIHVQSNAVVLRDLVASVRSDLFAQAAALDAQAARQADLADRASDAAMAQRAGLEAQRLAGEAADLRALGDPGAEFLSLTDAMPSVMVEIGGGVVLVERITADASDMIGRAVIPVRDFAETSDWSIHVVETPETRRRISDLQIIWVRHLVDRGLITRTFNSYFFTNADSREPELAGIRGALFGTILTMIVTLALAVPIGVFTAVYLEEFAPRNRFTDMIEVNINNLAAVPSIVFGLLGLAVLIGLFGIPRSTPLVGGVVLALMTLPTVIISTRASLRAVPPSIRQAALAVGASPIQAVTHHVLPLAAPGIFTGSIIGLAQALGETAPLLMVGMVGFFADAPPLSLDGFTTPSTVMPVLVFIWSAAAERAFEYRAALAIIVLLIIMIIFNTAAIYLRRRFERRW